MTPSPQFNCDLPVRVITFATYGEPFDRGIDLRSQIFVVQSMLEKQGIALDVYTPERVRRLGRVDLVREYEIKYKLERNPGLHAVGFGAWKPFVILDALSRVRAERVFYMDCDVKKYPIYRNKIQNLRAIVAYADRIGDFTVFRETAGQEVRAIHHSSNAQLGIIGRYSDFCKNFPLLTVNNVVCSRSENCIELLNEWLQYCTLPECILPPIHGDHDPDFRWFCPEQSVLNQVVARRIEDGKLPWFYPGISIGRGFTPTAVDNSHVHHLVSSKIDLLFNEQPNYFSEWTDVSSSLDDWHAIHDLGATRELDECITIHDGLSLDYHLLRLLDNRVLNSVVRVTAEIRPTPECSVGFHVQHSGGKDVVTFDKEGRLLLNELAAEATWTTLPDGFNQIDVLFKNLANTILIGLGDPHGHYKGHGQRQYVIRSIRVSCRAPITKPQ